MSIRTRAVLSFLVALVVSSCGSPTDPPEPFEVSMSAVVTFEDWNAETNRYECHYTLTAWVTGEAADEGAWLSGTFEVRRDNGTSQGVFNIGLVETVD